MSRYEIRYNERLLKHYFYDNELKEQISFDDILKVIEEQNKQLAEKDEEIETLKNIGGNLIWKDIDRNKQLKDQRHQICERIKKDVGCGSKWNGGWIEIKEETFLEILDDIDKGE